MKARSLCGIVFEPQCLCALSTSDAVSVYAVAIAVVKIAEPMIAMITIAIIS